MFKKFKKNSIARRKNDENLYSIVAQELRGGFRQEGLWLKAVERAGHNRERQISEYIRLRVQSLRDDIDFSDEILSEKETRTKKESITSLLDFDEFIAILRSGAPAGSLKDYFYGFEEKDVQYFINLRDSADDYPIHVAVSLGNIELVAWLLQAGASPNVANYWWKTPLDIARNGSSEEMVSLLKSHLR
ncbi:ankyrin repeat domain-containing protein [Thiohalospira halophila]|uniref:ankyrin repeat domain-containing protein n=1 Tax=Thiohalospira halophila TaxID=381300 RepID=UPI0013563D0B|nr:ankyrin repeat domain-containing protein [Thiohalospira halophila]